MLKNNYKKIQEENTQKVLSNKFNNNFAELNDVRRVSYAPGPEPIRLSSFYNDEYDNKDAITSIEEFDPSILDGIISQENLDNIMKNHTSVINEFISICELLKDWTKNDYKELKQSLILNLGFDTHILIDNKFIYAARYIMRHINIISFKNHTIVNYKSLSEFIKKYDHNDLLINKIFMRYYRFDDTRSNSILTLLDNAVDKYDSAEEFIITLNVL